VIRVYLVSSDDAFQTLECTSDYFSKDGAVPFFGRSLAAVWQPLRFYVSDPRLPRGAFIGISGDWFACSAETVVRFGGLLERFGELLPIEIEGEERPHFIWNVTATNASFDEANTVRKRYPNGTFGMPTKYVFHAEAVRHSGVFKSAGLPPSMLLVAHADSSSAGDFYATYAAQGCEGLEFKLLWANE
jgi:hypothetical protein